MPVVASLFCNPLTIVLEDGKPRSTVSFEPFSTNDHVEPFHPPVASPAAIPTKMFFEVNPDLLEAKLEVCSAVAPPNRVLPEPERGTKALPRIQVSRPCNKHVKDIEVVHHRLLLRPGPPVLGPGMKIQLQYGDSF
jgi:hypothetical protein